MAETHAQHAGPEPDPDFVANFAGHWEAACNPHQSERLLESMTDNSVDDDAAWPRTMDGHRDVRELVASIWRAVPGTELHTAEGPFLMPGTSEAAFSWKGTRTFTGPLDPAGFAPDRRADRVRRLRPPGVPRRPRVPAADRLRRAGGQSARSA